MKPLSGARRRGRIVAHDEVDDPDMQMAGVDHLTTQGTVMGPEIHKPPHANQTIRIEAVVKRPPPRTKKGSSSRLSFGPGGASASEDSSSSEVFTPKKSNLSRQAIEKNALKRSALSTQLSHESLQDRQAEERPSYSREYLTELKNSTPSTSKDRRSSPIEAAGGQSLDVAAKFGKDLARYEDRNRNPGIPTEVEIQEKKARRARLAKEQKYKAHASESSESGDDDGLPNQGRDSDEDEFVIQQDIVSFSSKPQDSNTRLTRDDEDMLEDFDSFVDDGRIKLGRKAEKEHEKRQREEMRDLIADAEGSSSEDSDDSEKQRRHEYEAAQRRKGMEGLHVRDSKGPQDPGARTPPKITPLPSLSSCLQRLRTALQEIEASRNETMNRLTEVESRRQEIPAQEQEIQQRLKEAGEQYEKLRAAAGMNGTVSNAESNPNGYDQFSAQRGLEMLGDVPRLTDTKD